MKKLSTLVVMLVLLACSTSAFAGTIKMIGTVTGIKIQGNGADITLKDRKTEAPIALKVTNPMELDKYKDKKSGSETNCGSFTTATPRSSSEPRKLPVADKPASVPRQEGP